MGVDRVAQRRQEVRAAVASVVTAATALRDEQPPGAARAYGDELVRRATALATGAATDADMAKEIQIDEVARNAKSISEDVETARSQLRMFDTVQGSFDQRRTKLIVLKLAGLDEGRIRQYLGLIKVGGPGDPAAYLIDVIRVAEEAKRIGVTKLDQLLPLADAAHLVNAIVLADHMQCSLADVVQHHVVLVAVGNTFDRKELAWFRGMPWGSLTSLLTGFTAVELATFAGKVARKCLDPLLQRGMTAAELYVYRANTDVLLNFEALRDDSWKHVYANIYASGSGQIGGGHDRAMFVHFVNNPPDGYTVQVNLAAPTRTVNSPLGVVEKFRYVLQAPTGGPQTGTKTVVTNLKPSEKAWRKGADEAVWNALRQGRLLAPPNWNATDNAGVGWAGKHDAGLVTSVYPDI